jgi:hypothetical protein
MDGALGCPMQMRMNGLVVRDVPRFVDPTPDDLSHTIQHPDGLVVPLSLDSVISYFMFRKPTAEEFDRCARYEFTSGGPEWDPYSTIFEESERLVNPGMVTIAQAEKDPFVGAMRTHFFGKSLDDLLSD